MTPEPSAANGFLVHSFAGDNPIVCLDYVRARLGVPAFTPQGGAPPRKPAAGAHQALARRAEAIRRVPARAELFVRVKDDGRTESALIAIAGLMRKGASS